MKLLSWVWFVVVQLITLVATIVGWVLLIPLCLLCLWTPTARSIKDGRTIDCWAWWLPVIPGIYDNPEDGVSGRYALIWNSTGTNKVPYMPYAWAPWRAYCWSAWRNSADQLKYVFAWEKGPFVQIGRVKLGWQKENGFNVPVLSL